MGGVPADERRENAEPRALRAADQIPPKPDSWVPDSSLAGFCLGVFLRSGRAPGAREGPQKCTQKARPYCLQVPNFGSGTAFKNVGGVAPHLLEGFPISSVQGQRQNTNDFQIEFECSPGPHVMGVFFFPRAADTAGGDRPCAFELYHASDLS